MASVTADCPRVCSRHVAIVPTLARFAVAGILAQTLFFKITYAAETAVIFDSRGGRPAATLVGLAELACVILLLVPRWSAAGAALALAGTSGAIFTHPTSLGIAVPNAEGGTDGGLLFGLALSVAVGATIILAYRWRAGT